MNPSRKTLKWKVERKIEKKFGARGRNFLERLNNFYLTVSGIIWPKFCGSVKIKKRNGNLNNYYHFLFDLLYPLVINRVDQKTNTFSIDSFHEFENFHHHLNVLFPNFCPEWKENGCKSVTFYGASPEYRESVDYEKFRQRIFTLLDLQTKNNPNLILLILRKQTDTVRKKKGPTHGAIKRTITNADELINFFNKRVKEGYVFKSLYIEDLNFIEQVKMFKQCVLLIGQHGAGLSNMVWMNPGNCVIEFGYRNKVHFKNLAQFKGLNYHQVPFENKHIKVNHGDIISLDKDHYIEQFIQK